MPNDLAASLKQTLIALIAPLRESATNVDLLRDWLAPLGYTPTTTDDPALPQIATKAQSIGASIEAIADGSLDSWDSISNLLQIGRQLQGLLADLRQFAATADPSKAAATLPDEIMSLLLATWLRREHPVFRRRRFFLPGDIQWLTPAGAEMTEPDWQAGYAKSVAVLLDGTAISEPDPRGDPVTDNRFLLLFNAGAEPITFTLPEPKLGGEWEIVVDTTYPEGIGNADLTPKSKVEVAGRAVIVLESEA